MSLCRLSCIVLSVASLLGSGFACGEGDTSTTPVAERIAGTPDLPQGNPLLPGRGSMYCAPVSTSNALAWLADQGYPKLLPSSQFELAKLLGTKQFMQTAAHNGTGVQRLVDGLTTYIDQCGYEIDDLTYQGWRSAKKDSLHRLPGHADVQEIPQRFSPNTVGLLNVGWYKRNGEDFERIGGHWVTLVGVEPGKQPVLLVHDPSGRSPEGDCERVTATPIPSGKLMGNKIKVPISAKDAWELGGELKINKKEGAETSILDGMVLLRLK